MSDRDFGPSDTAQARSHGLHMRQPSSAAGQPYDGVGEVLRATRLQSNRTLEKVAQSLRIRLVHLEAIEEGRFSDLPGSAYAIGFIRSYAEHLGLDGEAHVEQFKHETSTKVEATELKFPFPIPEGQLPGVRILVFSVLLIAAVYGVWYYVSQREQMSIEVVGEIPEHLAAIDEPVPDATIASAANEEGDLTLDEAAAMAAQNASPAPAKETDSALAMFVASLPSNGNIVDVSPPADAMGSLEGGAGRSEPEPADDELAVVTSDDASPAAVTKPDEPQQASLPATSGSADLESPPAVPTLSDAVLETGDDSYIPQVFGAGNDDSRVVIMARMDSWVQITGVGNELFLTRILRAGDKYFAPNRPDLVLMTGNAGAIQISVDGQAVPPLGLVGEVQRDISLNPDTLLAATSQIEGSGSTRGR
jgi:cytoskeleton protein RodZ